MKVNLTLVLSAIMTISTGALTRDNNQEVIHLMGQPDYRSVTLHWDAELDIQDGDSTSGITSRVPPLGYVVNYCELQAWGPHRCRNKVLDERNFENNGLNNEDQDSSDRSGYSKSFSMRIGGLRMATSYSFTVKPITKRREDRSDGGAVGNSIVVPTKGFSARATQCLPHASEISVSTGPYFAGRISVESTKSTSTSPDVDDACSISGDPANPRDTYTMRIDHELCGSDVNDTTVSTFVIVQENLPILTHSTRRFIVLCTYQPEILTVRAGLNLPNANRKLRGEAALSSRINAARSLSKTPFLVTKYDYEDDAAEAEDAVAGIELMDIKPAKLVDDRQSVEENDVKEFSETTSLSLVLMLITVVSGAIASAAALLYRYNRHRQSSFDGDDVSIASTTSCDTLEVVATTQCSTGNVTYENGVVECEVMMNTSSTQNECESEREIIASNCVVSLVSTGV